jgi:basic membrane lipoprotein Med (substrate-binding protein (PBP1-ABC) superfamily)
MTRLLIITALLVLGVAGFVLPAEGQSPRPSRFVVVVDQSSGRDRAAVDAATRAVEAARGAEAELRITRTPTEQLSVTSYFAARGYDVVGVGLDPGIAVDPVAERYPDTRFSLVDAEGVAAAAR